MIKIKKLLNKLSPLTFHLSTSRGFTLVELLASIIVLIAVGAIVSGIATSSLRGSSKATVIENIRQNGNYALSRISRSIQYAQTFNGFSNDGIDFNASCPDSFAPTPTPLVTYDYIKITTLNNEAIIYNCTPSSLSANGVSLIDTNSVTLTECVFSCIQNKSTDAPVIGINFGLQSARKGSLVEFSSPPIIFETSIAVKNYKK